MQNFIFYLPTKLVFGCGEIDKTGSEAKNIGKHALIVTGRNSASKSGTLDKVGQLLTKEGVAFTLFNRIEPNPRSTTIDQAAEVVRHEQCDFIIGLGGGSAMDAAKGIAAASAMNCPVWDLVSHGQTHPRPITRALPTMMIPTLAATSSESDSGGVITNWETHEKSTIFHPLLFPQVSIIDPNLTITVPKDYTLDGGIDIIAHVIESFFTGDGLTPLQDRFSLAITRTVMDFLPRLIDNPKDIEARTQVSWCASVALCGIVNRGRGGGFPNHAIEHALSGHYDISHGRGLAVLIPRLMAYTYQSRPDKFAFMAKELFGIRENLPEMDLARKAVEKMIEFFDSVARYISLPDVGITDNSQFETMADDTIRIYGYGKYLDNPRKLYKKDIIAILEMSMKKLPPSF